MKARIEIDHLLVPAELAVIDGDRHGRREERLGGRSDLKHGMGVDRLAALAADSEAPGIDHLVADDDFDRQSRNVEGLHVRCDIVLERGNDQKRLLLHRGVVVLGSEGAGAGGGKQNEAGRRQAPRAECGNCSRNADPGQKTAHEQASFS